LDPVEIIMLPFADVERRNINYEKCTLCYYGCSVTMPDGKTTEKDRKAGEVLWSGPVTHAVENVGTADQHVIVIELKK